MTLVKSTMTSGKNPSKKQNLDRAKAYDSISIFLLELSRENFVKDDGWLQADLLKQAAHYIECSNRLKDTADGQE